MSDTYTVGSTTVTPLGGGWYTLTHPSLTEPERVQGKENADTRALAISKGDTDEGDGSMAPQGGDLGGPTSAAANAELTGQKPADDGSLTAEEAAQLRKQLGEASDARNAAEAEAEKLRKTIETKTVRTDGGAVPPVSGKVPAGVPRRFEGKLDDKEKARLHALGLNLVTIVLEENENIPPTGLFIGHNGRGYMIVPGEEVDVPDFLLSVLDDAVMSAPVVDSKTQKVLGYRNRSRYPYRKIDAK